MRRSLVFFGAILGIVLTTVPVMSATGPGPMGMTAEQQLGMSLYCDRNLSINRNQSCASCHLPAAGFDDPDSNLPVSQGSILSKFGGRNAPSAAYAAFAPAFSMNADGLWEGGQFWDGRVNNLAEQAAGPPLNPVEMAMPDKKSVVKRLAENQNYVTAFRTLYGINLKNPAQTDAAYAKMAKAIGEFERSRRFNRFNSRLDFFLAGQATPTNQEQRGWDLFIGKAKCSLCHLIDMNPDGTPPLLTDFTYDNLGLPYNPKIAALQGVPSLPPDLGLGARILGEDGKFKVMSLRNIAVTAPYGHNGYFKTLRDIVHFYNTRDVLAECSSVPQPIPGQNCWPVPEVPLNVNTSELGNLGLSPGEEDDLVAFLKTFTDQQGNSPFGIVPVPPMP